MTVTMGKAILLVLTNVKELHISNRPDEADSRRTGYDIKEAALAYFYFHRQLGLEINLASPEGGECTIDPRSLKAAEHEEEVQAFLADQCAMQWTKCTDRLGEFDLGRFQAVIFVGGPGAMFDFPKSEGLAAVTGEIWRKGGVVAAIGHGAAALLSMKDGHGEAWVKGKKLTANTIEEDQEMRLEKMLPFSIERKLTDEGAKFKKSGKFANNVVVDERLVTGQNRNSTRDWLQQIDTLLQK